MAVDDATFKAIQMADIIESISAVENKCNNGESLLSITLAIDILSLKICDPTSQTNLQNLKSLLTQKTKISEEEKEVTHLVCDYLKKAVQAGELHKKDDIVICPSDQLDQTVDKGNDEEKHPKDTIFGMCNNCKNPICSSNMRLKCDKCGADFCEYCEKHYRKNRRAGEGPLCKKCFNFVPPIDNTVKGLNQGGPAKISDIQEVLKKMSKQGKC